MTKYTGKSVEQRRALLSLNLNGGGGLEIWQFTNRKSLPQKSPFLWGSLGINALILENNITTAQSYEQDLNGNWLVLEPHTNKKKSHEWCCRCCYRGFQYGKSTNVLPEII